MKLEKCSQCVGFVPPSTEVCPHCGGAPKRSRLGAAAVVLGSGAIAFTLMACYGAAPCAESGNCRPASPQPETATSSTGPDAPATPDAGK